MLCLEDLDPNKVKGKIAVCLEGGYVFPVMKGLLVAEAGAAGMIMCNHERSPNETSFEELHFLPVSHLNYEDCRSLYAYINSSEYHSRLLLLAQTPTSTCFCIYSVSVHLLIISIFAQ